MSADDTESLQRFVLAGAVVLDLEIDPAWLPAVTGHLQVILQHAALVAEFELGNEAEPAPVFQA